MTRPAPAESKDDLVRLENVTLRVGERWILPGTSWTIRRGQHWLVLGPNGSGKTSLTAALTGEVPVVAGRRRLNPDLLKEASIARVSFESHQRLIGRDEASDESREFAGLAEAGLQARVLLSSAAPEQLDSLASRLALTPVLHQPLRSLSTGEMRRLLLCRALLRRPRLLILDEPFDGLDALMRRRFAEMITDLAREDLQIVLVTHRMEESLPVMTHYLVLGDGCVQTQGALAETSTRRLPRLLPLVAARPTLDDEHDVQTAATDGNAPLIRMTGVCVGYGWRRVIEGLDWCVRRGENWLVSGPNGAGKSTLLGLVSGDHLQGYANAIELFGRRRGTGESIWEIKRRIGLVSSELQVRYRRPISGFEVVLSGFFDSVGLFHLAGRAQRERARRWIERLGIAEPAAQRFDRLSSGQQRMVLIARAVVKDPDLLILDEPCQGLDARNRANVIAMVDQIGRDTATTLIFTTHHADERPRCLGHELALSLNGAWSCRRLGR